ncbi:MAG: hypothetical protein ACE5G9_09670, partial [Nitrospinales bacterium]
RSAFFRKKNFLKDEERTSQNVRLQTCQPLISQAVSQDSGQARSERILRENGPESGSNLSPHPNDSKRLAKTGFGISKVVF